MTTTPTTKEESVARYQELYDEQMDAANSCDQSEIDRFNEINSEMAQLDRDFPGTLAEWKLASHLST